MKLLPDSQRLPALLAHLVPLRTSVHWPSVVLSVLVAASMAGCSDSRRSAAERATGGSPQPAPALALLATVPHSAVYVGDALPVHIQLTSPRARREAYLALRAREEGKAASVSSHRYVDRVPAEWPDRLVLTLVRVWPDGRREPVIESGAWSQWRATRSDRKGAGEIRIGDPVEQWRVPSQVAQLAPGRYVLSAQWNGNAVDASWLGSEGSLRAPDVAFEVRAPASNAERAEFTERRAQEEFEAGRYREARAQGQEALSLDPAGVLTHARAETYLLVARSSLALGDAAAAAETYRALLRRLPPPEANDLAVAVEQWLAAVQK